ncbi:HAMP domain-containing protein, partial [Bordetella ansorpii]|uniref:HAMP domain-containing protein n=1 Tax=Bordetella ansorpii TaxID=288768 RepID=UPI0012E885D8
MFSNLKVRTCIGIVLGLFCLFMAVSNGLSLLSFTSSNDKLDGVNRAYSYQVVPAYAGYVGLLRTRINLNESRVALGDNRPGDADAALQRGADYLAKGRQQIDALAKSDMTPDVAERAQPMLVALRAYAESSERQIAALRAKSEADYAALAPTVLKNSQDVEKTLDTFLAYVDGITNDMVTVGFAEFDRSRLVTIVLFVLSVLVCVGCGVFISRNVLRPLKEAGAHFDKIAGGDLTQRVDVRNDNEIGQLFAALKRMQESLTRTVGTVRRGVDEINVGAREISAGNTDLSSRTEQQAASLEQTAAS